MLALMHVATLWEEEPDMENIKTDLNCEYHFDNERTAKFFISTRLSCSNRRPALMRHGDTASFRMAAVMASTWSLRAITDKVQRRFSI